MYSIFTLVLIINRLSIFVNFDFIKDSSINRLNENKTKQKELSFLTSFSTSE